jgi:GNAT superfamily N-acetyltransferase
MRTDSEAIINCIRRAREMGLSICISGFGYRWDDQPGLYPRNGKPGIAYEHDDAAENLLYYDEEGLLRGIFKYFPNDIRGDGDDVHAGDFTVLVDPARWGRGIGTNLLRAAVERWEINFKQQRYTLSGAELVMHFLQRHPKK